MQPIQAILGKKLLIFDGAMGTMLMKAGVRPEEGFDLQNLTNPDKVQAVHQAYVDAGANIIETNTFGANRIKLADYNASDKVKEINIAAARIAKQALRQAQGPAYVCGSIGPLGKLLRPYGEVTFDEAYEVFAEQAQALEEGGADILCIETISDLQEMRAAIIAAKQNTKLPLISSMTYDENQRTVYGTPPEVHAVVAQALGADVISANCSTGPEGMLKVIERLVASAFKALVMVMPNAGMPVLEHGEALYKMKPEEFAKFAEKFAKIGVSIIGGCCGTSPDHIKAISSLSLSLPKGEGCPKDRVRFASRSKVVEVKDDQLLKVGERINPTGRKAFREELKAGDFSTVKAEAKAQSKAGADLLDVNVSAAMTDDVNNIIKAIDIVSQQTDLPISIDSPKEEVIENGLKEFCGRALINSVNGKEESLNTILPLAKKYGAAIIGLCLDEKGIPKTVEDRLRIAEKIVSRAQAAGIAKEDIFIDCLVMTAAVDIKECLTTLEAVKKVKEKFGVKTILGVSNVSHGLPQRSKINKSYLSLATQNGLDAGIIDPAICTDAMHRVSLDDFKNALEKAKQAPKEAERSAKPKPKTFGSLEDIKELVIDGDAETCTLFVKQALEKGNDPQKIIDTALVAGMEIVGEKFSKKEYFLPQVLSSAEAMRVGFVLCKEKIPKEETKKVGKVLIATVFGDIHDIGKNIVRMLLENHGFEIIDLGKDVHPDKILEAATKERPDVIALSALLTTTMVEMGTTRKKLKEAGLDIPVIIGGAVVTDDYADSIGAARGSDAAEAVKLAKLVIKKGGKR